MSKEVKLLTFYEEAAEYGEEMERLNKKQVRIEGANDWGKVKKITNRIKEWEVEILKLILIRDIRILTGIKNIIFPRLQQIFLWDNNLPSVESLCRIMLPSLRILHLGGNDLSTIKIARKCYMPSLEWFEVKDNKIRDGRQLTELAAETLTKISFEWGFSDPVTPIQFVDLRWMGKSSFHHLSSIQSRDVNKTCESNFLKALQRRHPMISLNA